MKIRRVIFALIPALLAAAWSGSPVLAEARDGGSWLVVLNAKEGGFAPSEDGGYLLTLSGVSDHILAFSASAQGSMNAIDLARFVERWNSAANDGPAPRIALDTLKDENEEIYVLELSGAELDEKNNLRFRAAPVEDPARVPGRLSHRRNSAELPEDFGTAALFMDNVDFLMEDHG